MQRESSHYRSEPNHTDGKKSPILSLADIWTKPIHPQGIINMARYGWVSGGSLVPQSTADFLHVFITQLYTDFTFWIVNYNTKFRSYEKDDDHPHHEVDDEPSTQRIFGRIIKFALATTSSNGRPQFIRQRADWIEMPSGSSHYRSNPIQRNMDKLQSTRSWIGNLIIYTFSEF
jgi:hypothetical protein